MTQYSNEDDYPYGYRALGISPHEKGPPLLFRNGKLYSLEESDEGYSVIKRYRVIEASGAAR